MTKPAFTGELQFDLIVGIFGETVTRPAKITYRYTPVWPYFDVNTRTERDEDVIVGIGLRVLAPPTPRTRKSVRRTKEAPRWIRCDPLLSTGALHPKIYKDLWARIEREALATDRRNRIYAGAPFPPLPKQN